MTGAHHGRFALHEMTVKNQHRAILERYFRIKKFTCISCAHYMNEIDRLKETCSWRDWRNDLNSLAIEYAPRDGYAWINGQFLHIEEVITKSMRQETARMAARERELQWEVRDLRSRVAKLESERTALISKLESERTAFISDNFGLLATAMLDRRGRYQDSEIPELELRTRPGAGRDARSWYVRISRPRAYPTKFKKLGNFGVLDVIDAREMARRVLAGETSPRPKRVRLRGKNDQEARALAQALYEMEIIKPGELQ